jgi:hypothetical protein
MCSVEGCTRTDHCRGLCRKHYDADRYAKNPDAGRTYAINYRKNNPERYLQIRTPEYNRDRQLKTNYGLTLDDFRQMSVKQAGRCAVCGEERQLCVDHDHRSGAVRALLCQKCNRGLGHFDDNPALLECAAAYLKANQKDA